MATSDFRNDASAAYEVRKELGPEYERAVLESFVANATESINQQVDARLAQYGVGVTVQSQVPGQGQKQPQPDNSHLAVPVFSVVFGVVGSVWLTAGADAESDAVFAMWLGITLVNIVFLRMLKGMRSK
jgi:hypothetical protein